LDIGSSGVEKRDTYAGLPREWKEAGPETDKGNRLSPRVVGKRTAVILLATEGKRISEREGTVPPSLTKKRLVQRTGIKEEGGPSLRSTET